MAGRVRNLVLAALVVGVTWSAAVAYWRGSATGPTATDLVLVMLGLPILLLGGLWCGRRLLAPAANATPAAAPAVAPAAVAPPSAAPSMAILATSLRMPHGESAAQLLAALERSNARATLDPELLGDDGYPIMSVHAQAADDADGRAQVADWIERHGGDGAVLHDEHVRALLLGGAVAQELGALALDLCGMPEQAPPAPATGAAGAAQLERQPAPRRPALPAPGGAGHGLAGRRPDGADRR